MLWHFRHIQITDILDVVSILVHFEVFGELGVHLLELGKLLLCHWLVVSILPEHGQEVCARDLAFICLGSLLDLGLSGVLAIDLLGVLVFPLERDTTVG